MNNLKEKSPKNAKIQKYPREFIVIRIILVGNKESNKNAER
jgi:hypothetical protein